jgi:hypothetical protein
MTEEHGWFLLERDMQEIVNIVIEMQNEPCYAVCDGCGCTTDDLKTWRLCHDCNETVKEMYEFEIIKKQTK